VGRTSTAVEAVGEDPAAVGEAVAWTRQRWRRCGVEAVAWTRLWWRQRSTEVHAESEGVNLAAVREAVGDSQVWT
jgi:hypothetical protein